MIRLLARLHGVEQQPAARDKHDREPTMGLTKGSALLGMVTSSFVIAHLAALGSGGALLFLRYGTGYSPGETTMLAGMAIISVLSFGFAARRSRRRQAGSTPHLKSDSA